MTVDVFALEGCATEAEDGEGHGNDAAADERGLHHDVHQEGDAVCEVEAVDGQTKEWSNRRRADCATVLKVNKVWINLMICLKTDGGRACSIISL